MRFLDTLELYIYEGTEDSKYSLVPVDFDEENAYSFSVESDGKEIAKISIKTLDGQPIDALSAPYHYDEVYADVKLEYDEDNPGSIPLLEWIIEKLDNMGYDENTIRINNEKHSMDDEGPQVGSDAERADELPDSYTGYDVDYNDSEDDAKPSSDFMYNAGKLDAEKEAETANVGQEPTEEEPVDDETSDEEEKEEK